MLDCLVSAARFGHLNVITWLVDFKKCSALDRAQNGVTPVHLAAAKGSINCLKWLSQTHPRCVQLSYVCVCVQCVCFCVCDGMCMCVSESVFVHSPLRSLSS